MGFMDKIKKASSEMASDIAQQAQDKVASSIETHKQNQEIKQAAIQEQKDLAALFNPTKTVGDISIDTNNGLFKVKHATASIKKSSGVMAKTGKATAALLTLGGSVALEQAMKPDDKVFRFTELRSFELLEDDSEIVSGGVGKAIVGGALFGGFGAVAGAVAGNKKTKKTVDNMVLKINTHDINFPCIMITYINKTTKVTSNDYRKSLSLAQETISCLEIILNALESMKAAVEQQNAVVPPAPAEAPQQPLDPVSEIKKYKELLDMGAISEDEYNTKKSELLGL